ncbi:MAG: hypothetical protein M3O46_20940 [Myxococcota bacterium]|nr:hypothetical protein [Myxococcota bacterium]
MRELIFGVTRPVAVVALVSAVTALAGVVACSLIVSNGLPPYMCSPREGNSVCPTDQICAPTAGAVAQFRCCDPHAPGCTADSEGGNDMMGDDGGMSGDVRTGDAMDAEVLSDADSGTNDGLVPCRGLGCRCTTTANCPASFACVDKVSITADIWAAWIDAGGINDAGGFCAETCCTSGDCDLGDGGSATVCFGTGAGGNYCVPPSWLGDRSAIGIAGGGASCGDDASADAATVCRSGLCLDSGVCADTCCSTRLYKTECSGSGCRFGAFPGAGFDNHQAANCAVPIGSDLGTSPCMSNDQCRSNLCLGFGGFGGMGSCRDACRLPADCPANPRSQPTTCGYVQPNPPDADLVAACMAGGRVGDAGDGMPCRSSGECAQGYCAQNGPQGVCIAVCFADSDCPQPERCRPQTVQLSGGTYSVLACGM